MVELVDIAGLRSREAASVLGVSAGAVRIRLMRARERGYAFTGSLFCGVCDRRMQGHWINAAPCYRCRFPDEYAVASKISHPRNVYLRQGAFEARINQWLATVFAPARHAATIDQIMAGQQARTEHAAAQAAMARIEDAIGKMARYRAALDADGDPEEIGKWIARIGSCSRDRHVAFGCVVRQQTDSW